MSVAQIMLLYVSSTTNEGFTVFLRKAECGKDLWKFLGINLSVFIALSIKSLSQHAALSTG